jgi:hypothetical protein
VERNEYNQFAGLDLVRQIRQIDVTIPFFIYSGSRAVEIQDELRASGVTLVTNKPSVVFLQAVRVLVRS